MKTSYKFIGKLAKKYYAEDSQITFSELNSLFAAEDLKTYKNNWAVSKCVKAAYHKWKEKDEEIAHAVAVTFTQDDGQLAWDKKQ